MSHPRRSVRDQLRDLFRARRFDRAPLEERRAEVRRFLESVLRKALESPYWAARAKSAIERAITAATDSV